MFTHVYKSDCSIHNKRPGNLIHGICELNSKASISNIFQFVYLSNLKMCLHLSNNSW